jgi:putative flippase GtrA
MNVLSLRPVRFLFSGGSAAVVSVSTFILFTEVLHIWYLIASVISYTLSFFVNFFLQKYWTFRNKDNKVPMQMGLFFAGSLLNLVLNATLMFIFVDVLKFHHIPAYVVVLGLLAIMNYMLYKFVIFRNSAKVEATPSL